MHSYRDGISEKIDFTFLDIIREKTDEVIRNEQLSTLFDEEMEQFQQNIDRQRELQADSNEKMA